MGNLTNSNSYWYLAVLNPVKSGHPESNDGLVTVILRRLGGPIGSRLSVGDTEVDLEQGTPGKSLKPGHIFSEIDFCSKTRIDNYQKVTNLCNGWNGQLPLAGLNIVVPV